MGNADIPSAAKGSVGQGKGVGRENPFPREALNLSVIP